MKKRLELHKLWLMGKSGGRKFDATDEDLIGADLTGEDLRWVDMCGANLKRANLEGADIDFSCWPLWCGSLNVNIDERIAKQLMYHALAVSIKHLPKEAVTQELIDFVNGFHRVVVGSVPKLEK